MLRRRDEDSENDEEAWGRDGDVDWSSRQNLHTAVRWLPWGQFDTRLLPTVSLRLGPTRADADNAGESRL